MQDQPESSLLLCRMSQQEGKKKDTTKKKGLGFRKVPVRRGRHSFCFLFFVTAVSSGRRHRASGKHPGALGIRQDVRMPAPWGKGTMAV